MRSSWRLILIGAIAAVSSAASAAPAYLVSESTGGNVWRIQDVNNDGDALDVGERTLWATGLTLGASLESVGAGVFATDVHSPISPNLDQVVRLIDINGDGDALDAGESLIWADNLSLPLGSWYDSANGFYVAEQLTGDVLHFSDNNGDGDALDAGESVLFADGIAGARDLLPWGDDLLVSGLTLGEVFKLSDNNGDGDALDLGERLPVLAGVTSAAGLMADGNGGFFVTSLANAAVYHATDKNGDGDFLDLAEVLVYADSVFGGIIEPWNMAAYPGGGFLLTDRASGKVLLARDGNGDGDALDLGEVTVFADGIPGGPIDLALLPDADFDDDGDVDGFDFLTWQRGFGADVGAGNMAPLANGNANGDQFIDGDDFAIWEIQFGTTGLLTAQQAAATTVPEPSTLGLVFVALGSALLRRRSL